MATRNKSLEGWFMVFELLFGIILSIIYFRFTLYSDAVSKDDYLLSFIKFFAYLSLLFFFAVFSIGIIGARRYGQAHNIGKAILYSFIFWALSLVISVWFLDFFAFFGLYIILVAIIVGFNIGLRRKR